MDNIMNTTSIVELQQQAEAGVAKAQLQLGMIALQQQDVRTAMHWLHKAAEQKIAKAAEVIGALQKEAGQFSAISASMRDLQAFLQSPK